ncbi:hypothetical protein LXA43DRAFT_890138, partial [Ganoderma leucocontextum]
VALLFYDFILTLPHEAERFWTGRRSWASVFFFLNRYTAILFHIPVIYEIFYVMPESVSQQNCYDNRKAENTCPQRLAQSPRSICAYPLRIKSDHCLVPHPLSVLAVSWGVMVIFDGTVFVLTLCQAICGYRLWSYSLATSC